MHVRSIQFFFKFQKFCLHFQLFVYKKSKNCIVLKRILALSTRGQKNFFSKIRPFSFCKFWSWTPCTNLINPNVKSNVKVKPKLEKFWNRLITIDELNLNYLYEETFAQRHVHTCFSKSIWKIEVEVNDRHMEDFENWKISEFKKLFN